MVVKEGDLVLCGSMRPSCIGSVVTLALRGLARLPVPEEDTSIPVQLAVRRASGQLRGRHTLALCVWQVAECEAHVFSAGIG